MRAVAAVFSFVASLSFFGIWAELDGKAVRHAGMSPINRRNVEAFRGNAVAAIFAPQRFREGLPKNNIPTKADSDAADAAKEEKK